MKPYRQKAACCGCGACAELCAAGAIQMVPDLEGFLYPRINRSLCTRCGQCAAVCPLRHQVSAPLKAVFFGAQAKDELRRGSSSGGMFPVLARYVLQRQGVVFGTGFREDMEVVHREAQTTEQLEELRRTKYVQSRLDGVYRRVKDLLDAGRWVLFCGTPCQVHGLHRFLGRPYPQLILADLICYGVPSPGLWRTYVDLLERRYGGRLTVFSFRDKRGRDNGHTRSFVIDGREYVDPLADDLYCGMYFSNLTLRPSCHACHYCTPDRESDFTLGDFWGIERIRPELDDGMGTSLVILHTRKAQDVWAQLRGELDWFACEQNEALQPRLEHPTAPARGRNIWLPLLRFRPLLSLLRVRPILRLAQRLWRQPQHERRK